MESVVTYDVAIQVVTLLVDQLAAGEGMTEGGKEGDKTGEEEGGKKEHERAAATHSHVAEVKGKGGACGPTGACFRNDT